MIKNNIQYEKAKSNLVVFIKNIEDELVYLKSKQTHPVEIEMRMNQLNARKDKILIELREYEDLLNCPEILIQDIYDLPKAIIKARLKVKCSQKELANKIEVAEQQIQRYEAQEYNKANLERVIQIIDALDIEVKLKLRPRKQTRIIDLMPKLYNLQNLELRKKLKEQNCQLMVVGE